MRLYRKLFHSFNSTFMLMIPLSILFQSCLGSMAAFSILKNKGALMLWQLGLCLIVTMVYNASILALLKPKIVFNLLILTTVTNTVLLIAS